MGWQREAGPEASPSLRPAFHHSQPQTPASPRLRSPWRRGSSSSNRAAPMRSRAVRIICQLAYKWFYAYVDEDRH